MSWNDYLSYVRHSFIKRLKNKNNKNNNELDERKIIWIRLPYLGERGDQMKRNCFRKVKRYLNEEAIFRTLYISKKLSMFCSSKDQIPTDPKSNLIYRFTCPGCNEKYIGKTERNISPVYMNTEAVSTNHCTLPIEINFVR